MEASTHIKNVFKNGTLTTEDYTHVWIEVIKALECKKSVNFSKKN